MASYDEYLDFLEDNPGDYDRASDALGYTIPEEWETQEQSSQGPVIKPLPDPDGPDIDVEVFDPNEREGEDSNKSGDYDAFLNDLEQRYGVGDTPEDLARLKEYQAGVDRYNEMQRTGNWDLYSSAVSSPDQLEQFMRDLEAQYSRRGGIDNDYSDGDDDDNSSRTATSSRGPSRQSVFNDLAGLGSFFGGPGRQGVFQGPLQQVGEDPFSRLLTGGLADLIGSQGRT